MKEKGYITVYLSLILMVTLAVLFTTLESARMSGARMKYQMITLLGLESIFADYYSPLLMEYGLLFLNGTYQTGNSNEFQNKLEEYIEYNLNPNKGLNVKGNDLYLSSLTSIDVVNKTLATDYGGDILESEILSYMKYAMPADGGIWILEKAGLVGESKVVKSFFDDLSKVYRKAEKVDKAVNAVSENIIKIREHEDEFKENANQLKAMLFELEELYDREASAESQEEERYYQMEISSVESSATRRVNKIISEQRTLYNYTKKANDQKKEYDKWTNSFMEDLLVIEQTVKENGEDLSDEMRSTITEEINSLKGLSGGQTDYYKLERVSGLLRENEEILEGNINNLKSFRWGVEEGDIRSLIRQVNYCESNMRDYNKFNLTLNYQNKKVKKEDDNFLDEINRIIDGGFYSLVIPKSIEISKKVMEMNNTPSKAMPKERLNGEKSIKRTEHTFLSNEYAIKKFGNIVEIKEEKVLDYELEYILEGEDSDEKNLKGTINKILGIREGMNLIYLFSDSGKRKEAEMLAITLVGATGMYGLIKITQLLILAAWAFVESIIDVRSLLSGNSIELIKTRKDWNTSLTNVINFSKNDASSLGTDSKSKKGLCYQDYLRLLLLSEKRENKLYRMMDLIQGNIQKNYDLEFYMENCIYSMEVEVVYEMEQMFLSLPFMKGYVGKGQNYEFLIRKSYSYN